MVDKIPEEVKWIKISTGLFEDEAIQMILDMPDGAVILEIWLRLLIAAGKKNDRGLIYFKENIPYTTDILATLFNKKNKQIEFALKTFSKFGMIKILDSNQILISNWEKYQNSDQLEKIRAKNNERQKRYREKQKALLQNNEPLLLEQKNDVLCNVTNDVTVTHSNGTDIDIELDIDTCNSNNSLSHEKSVTYNDERDEFYKFLRKKYKAENPQAYIAVIKKNGDYGKILKEYGEYKAELEAKKSKNDIKADYLKVIDKFTAASFIAKYGDPFDLDNINHPSEVMEMMKKYDFESWAAANDYCWQSRER